MTTLKQGPLRCDCCGTERLARVEGEKLIITDRRGGKRHILVLQLDNNRGLCVESESISK